MNIPTNLKHKPVIVCENYENIDGRKAYNSEAKGLSLGLAQWNDRGNVDASAKVWRNTGEKWSRQSEELPIHRLLDLAILYVRAQIHLGGSYQLPKLYDERHPQLDRIGLQGDAMTVSVCTTNEFIDTDIKLFREALIKDEEMLAERCRVLGFLLKEAGFVK